MMRLINIAGLIYNHCIALHKHYYKLYGKHLHKYALQKHITKLKHRSKRFAYMQELDAQAIHDITDRIEWAYNNFWRKRKQGIKASPPGFMKVRRYKSFTLRQSGWKLDEPHGRIRLFFRWYRYFQSRNIMGKIKTVTIKRDALGNIYVHLVCDIQYDTVRLRSGSAVGLDFGLKRFLTASDGHDIESPDFFTLNADSIRKKHRKLSRKKKGSRNRERARMDLARAYIKSVNQRKDFHFKTARRLCEQYAVICLEDLNIAGMAKIWGRKIYSLGFYQFVRILQHEASKLGTRVAFVDRFYPSSQLCSTCGYRNHEVKENMNIREWKCPQCGTVHDRDRNAAMNILRAGASAYSGGTVRPEKSGSVVDATIRRR